MGRQVPPRPLNARLRNMDTNRLSHDRQWIEALGRVYWRDNPYGIAFNPTTMYELYRDLAQNHYLKIVEKREEEEPEGAVGFWIHPLPEDEEVLCATLAIFWIASGVRSVGGDSELLRLAEADLSALGVETIICPDIHGTPQVFLSEGYRETERVYSKDI